MTHRAHLFVLRSSFPRVGNNYTYMDNTEATLLEINTSKQSTDSFHSYFHNHFLWLGCGLPVSCCSASELVLVSPLSHLDSLVQVCVCCDRVVGFLQGNYRQLFSTAIRRRGQKLPVSFYPHTFLYASLRPILT